MSTTSRGREAETKVCRLLESWGYTVMHRNFICAHGEIDIIAEDDEHILIVEVRMRKKGSIVSGAESISSKKADTMRRCAREYIARAHMPDFSPRIDVAQVESEDTPDGVKYTIEYFENALEL